MTDANVPESTTQPPSEPKPPAPKKRRKWPWILLGIVGLLILLVLLGPTIASTSPVRSMVVSKVNANLNGKLDISDWSIGWTSGVTLTGIKLDDDKGRRIVEVSSVRLPISLIGAARGNYDLGNIVIEKPNILNLEVYEDGTTNLDKLTKDTPKESKPATEPKKDEKPSKLPDVKGKITITEARGTIAFPDSKSKRPPIYLDPTNVVIDIAGINQPIKDTINLAFHVGTAPQGTVTIAGDVSAIQNNLVAVDQLKANQTVDIAAVDLSAFGPFVSAPGAAVDLAGLAKGTLHLKADTLKAASVDGQLSVADLSVGGQPLKGDTYKSKALNIPINVTVTPQGASDSLVKIDKLQVESDHILVDVSGQATQSALQNLAANKPPGSDGAIALAVTSKDIPGLTNSLRNSLGLQKDVAITSGKFATHVNVVMSANNKNVVIKQDLDVQAAGTNAGKQITLDPVHLDTTITALPTGKPTPDLRDVALNLASAFATAAGGGKSLDDLNIHGDFDLAKLNAQLAQFADLAGKSFAGAGKFTVTSQGNLTADGGKSDIEAKVTLDNVIVHGLAAKGDLIQPHAVLDATATLQRGKNSDEGFIGLIPVAKVTFQSGDANAPVVDLLATATNVNLASMGVENFNVQKMAIPDLARAQQQFAAFMPPGFQATSGSINATITGSCVNRLMQFDEKAQIQNVTLQTVDKQNVAHPLIVNENEDIAVAGTMQTTADTMTSTIKLTNLAASSSNKLFSLAKSPEQPLEITLHDNGKTMAIAGNGQVTVASDLKQVLAVLQSMSNTPAPAAGAPGQLTSGNFTATLKLAQNDKGGTIHVDGGIDNLSVTTAQQPISNEKIALNLDATTPSDFSGVNVSSATINSSFAKTTVTDAQLQLAGGTFDMLQKAKLEIAVPDINKLMNVAQAFSPPAQATPSQVAAAANPTATSSSTPAKPMEPLQIGGGAVIDVSLVRDQATQTTHLTVPQIAASKMSMVRGTRKFAFDKPIAINLAADLTTENVTSTASTQPVQQIKQLQIIQMGGDLGGLAALSMPQPITVTNLSSVTPSANGKIALTGAIEPLMRLLSVIQDAEPMPYRGDYAVNENIGTQKSQISLVGDVTVNKLVVLQADGKPAFSEDKLVVADNLLADAAAKTATINDLSVNMTSSKAASVEIKGSVADWEVKRQFSNFTINLGYDLAKIWPIIKPMMSPAQQTQFADLKIAGQFQRTFNIGGSFPASAAGKPLLFNESIKSLTANGALGVQSLSTNGATLTDLEIPITLAKGKLETLDASKPKNERAAKPAGFNGGTLDLSSMEVDLTSEVPRLSIGKNQQLVKNAAMNEILARALGKYANSIFASSEKAKGNLDVTIAYCDNLLLGQQLQTDTTGKAKILFSLTNMELINPVSQQIVQSVASQIQGVSELASVLGYTAAASGDMSNAKTLQGGVENGSIILENGKITEDITMQLVDSGPANATGAANTTGSGKKHGSNSAVATPGTPAAPGAPVSMPLTVKGDMTLSDMSQNLAVNVPARLVGNAIGIKSVQDFLTQAFPNGIPFRMTGTPDKFALKPLVGMKDAAKDFLVGHFLTGNGKNGSDSGLGGLLDGLGQKKKKK